MGRQGLIALATGAVIHSPNRDPLVVALASLAVGDLLAARWFDVKRFRPAHLIPKSLNISVVCCQSESKNWISAIDSTDSAFFHT